MKPEKFVVESLRIVKTSKMKGAPALPDPKTSQITTNKAFKYTDSFNTDIRATWEKYGWKAKRK